MMNFWISLYVSIVITVFGSVMIGSDGQHVQISRIGSQDQIRTQDGPTTSPSKLLEQTLPTPPDEQQSQDPATNLTNIHFQVPDPPSRMYRQQYPRLIYPIRFIDQTPPRIFVRPHEFPTRDPNRIRSQFPNAKNKEFPIILYSIQYI